VGAPIKVNKLTSYKLARVVEENTLNQEKFISEKTKLKHRYITVNNYTIFHNNEGNQIVLDGVNVELEK
jgi:hypothetical protein